MTELAESTQARKANPVNRIGKGPDKYGVNSDSAQGTTGSGAEGQTVHSNSAYKELDLSRSRVTVR